MHASAYIMPGNIKTQVPRQKLPPPQTPVQRTWGTVRLRDRDLRALDYSSHLGRFLAQMGKLHLVL